MTDEQAEAIYKLLYEGMICPDCGADFTHSATDFFHQLVIRKLKSLSVAELSAPLQKGGKE